MLSLFIAAVIAVTPFDAGMSTQEMKQTGVTKLSQQEKLALTSWIDSKYTKKLAQAPQKNTPPILEENLNSGTYIRLSDKSLWQINPADTPITQAWITPVEIKVAPNSNDSNYPFMLTNTLTGSTVRARKAESVPQAPKAPAQAVKQAPPAVPKGK